MAGPDDTSQLRRAHEAFVHPGYADLNPSYEQPANATPVWSLAKPLPRVVRPGMVPTKQELLENRGNAQIPAQNSQKLGLDVDPNQVEQGQIGKHADPRKMAAQVDDARAQRENNFLNRLITGDTSSRLSRVSSSRLGRRPTGRISIELPMGDQFQAEVPEHLQAVPEEEEERDEEGRGDDDDKLAEELDLNHAEYPEDLHPLVQDLVEGEIHNNHTTWSVIRTHHREALAESLAAFIQLTIGFSADLSVTIANNGNPNSTDWAWGFATMTGIYISGGISGGHLNPSMTSMLWYFRGFPKKKMPEYFFAQFMGAFPAAFAAYGLYYHSIQEYLSTNGTTGIVTSFVTGQRESWIGPATAFWNEFIGTMILAITVLALGDDQNAPPGAGMNALIIGLVVTCLSIAFGYQTGGAFNPSRDFGPRLALLALGFGSDLFLNSYWFYGPWVGSVCGAFIGAFLYDFFIFTGGESPVNYPLERTQRAIKKSGMKWKRRLHLGKVDPSADGKIV